jgi:hypothetical protein
MFVNAVITVTKVQGFPDAFSRRSVVQRGNLVGGKIDGQQAKTKSFGYDRCERAYAP